MQEITNKANEAAQKELADIMVQAKEAAEKEEAAERAAKGEQSEVLRLTHSPHTHSQHRLYRAAGLALPLERSCLHHELNSRDQCWIGSIIKHKTWLCREKKHTAARRWCAQDLIHAIATSNPTIIPKAAITMAVLIPH